ncbi:MAG: NAD(P)/FAD-dependent oxidoreductase [Kiritimatiellia bacterium]
MVWTLSHDPEEPPRLDPGVRVVRRSIDARRGRLKIVLTLDDAPPPPLRPFAPKPLHGAPAIIVGSGPAGLFAALELLERGIRPIVLERGPEVSARKRAVAQLCRSGELDPEANYCFGEGGAGTFSDGKLFTRSTKRGDNRRVLELLAKHGAPADILTLAHPHLGSDRLPGIVAALRRRILESGGEVHFDTRVDDLLRDSHGRVAGVRTTSGREWLGRGVILAIGHSARDTLERLAEQRIPLEPKGFALGVRVEHPQELITRIQYHDYPRPELLPVAEYSLRAQIGQTGVHTFCMCPGGFIVPASSAPQERVVNGMSPYRRNTPFANAGTVVQIPAQRFPDAPSALAYQRRLEHLAYRHSPLGARAAAQRLADFAAGRPSRDLPPSSYLPGLEPSDLHRWLPPEIANPLRHALRLFGAQMRGYLTNDAVAVALESRTSSPVRICRDPDTLQSPAAPRLYPCGEGAGYAGGILSSAIDGQRCAQALAAEETP